jgi:serine/threonine protein kinase
MADIVAWGSFGMVVRKPDSPVVLKSAHQKSHQRYLDVERRIYERFEHHGGHENLLRYHGSYDDNFAIKLEYVAGGSLDALLLAEREKKSNEDEDEKEEKQQHHPPIIPLAQRHQWALQLASALDFIHRHGVLHDDLSSNNIFLADDRHLATKLGDFSGSSLDGSELFVYPGPSYAHPTRSDSQVGDRFAYGSVVFEILTGEKPFVELGQREIERNFALGRFPDTGALGSLGEVVRRCWAGGYEGTWEMLRHVREIISSSSAAAGVCE